MRFRFTNPFEEALGRPRSSEARSTGGSTVLGVHRMGRRRALKAGLRHQRWIPSMIMALALILSAVPSALAVHDTGAFELDGDATSLTATPPTADWDAIC